MHFINFFFINSINYDVNERILMPSKSRLFSQLIAGSGQIKANRLSDDISTIEQVASTEDLTAVGNTVGDQRVINNNLYIWNGSGWYRIALINASPTWDSGGQPEATYTLDADSPQDPTIITLAASDPDGLSISYNYITSGQMDSIATISQDSSVFTITPKTSTQAPDGGTGSITFRATDGINILPQVSSFTLNFISIIENSNHTTLLATATGGSDNNNITDASSNNHSITVSGDAPAGTFSPYRSGGYSVHLDDGEEISFPDSSNYNLSNGSFSIEAWVYPTSYDSPWSGVVSQFSSSSRGWGLAFSSTQITFLGSTNGGSSTNVNGSVTSSVPLNQWTHLLVTRDSNTIRIFNNGVLVNNFTESGTFNNSTNPLRIGELNSNSSENFRGYIRDARVVKGSVPTEYQTSSTTNSTTIFSVPSEPLTAVTDTVLLTCHLPYISDGSTNNATPTLSGIVSTKPFSPYDYLEYAAADNGGSVHFDGTGDYLTIPDHSSLNFASNDWTIECWIYPRTNVSDCGIWHQSASGTDWYSIYLDGAFNPKFVFYNSSNGVEWAGTAASNTAPQNTWTHVALVRQFGTGVYLYANGKLVASDTLDASVTMLDKTYNHVIGYKRFVGSGTYFDGFISDFKMDIGTAHYTGEFTPPTAPLSSSGADMHIKGTDASIIDKTQGSNLKLFGNTTGSTSQIKFGGSKSMYFDGSGDYITIPNDEAYGFGTDDWTIETWLYCTKTGGFNAIFDTRVGTGTQTGNFSIGMYTTGRVQLFSGGIFYYPTDTLSFNTWQHFAVVKNSGTTTMYFNGTAASLTYSDSRDYGSSQPVQIGKDDTTSNYFGGYMQDFRITKGLARYTANFTPPIAPLEG